MQIPERDELWLVDGEQRFLITPKIYDLLVSKGADLPPAYGIDALREQNAKLRELVDGLRYCAHEAHGMCARVPVGGERPFTCCPLYDFDGKEYRCEKLMLELGLEVS